MKPESRTQQHAVADARAAIRAGTWTGHTSGVARDHVQGNVVILPRAQADDFLRYCQLNPKPCPVLAVSEPGQPTLPRLGADIDIRSDVPRYRVWRHGEVVVCEVHDAGRFDQPLAGRVRPTPDQTSGFGLWLANQVCDLVQIRSFEDGSVVRLHISAGDAS